MELSVYQQLGIALGLGLLVGFQREWDEAHVAGIRTFALITLFGTVCGLLGRPLGGWVAAAGMLAVTITVVVGAWVKYQAGEFVPGLTTEIAAILMYGVGVLIALDMLVGAVAAGGIIAVLLHWKQPLHTFVDRLGRGDVRAVIQFSLIALVILPVLPNRTYGPYDVLNPFNIWLLVVLIVGISVLGHITFKFIGSKAGTILIGILGGVISSTATTINYARHTREEPESIPSAALIITIASTIVFGRVIFEVYIIAPDVLPRIILPLLTMAAVMTTLSVGVYFCVRGHETGAVLTGEPSNLATAVIFGALYAIVIIAVAAADDYLGTRGMYLIAGLSGLTDMDAITLSTAQMIHAERVDAAAGWRMIVIGAMANNCFKTLVIAGLGHRRLLRYLVLIFGLSLIGGISIMVLWP